MALLLDLSLKIWISESLRFSENSQNFSYCSTSEEKNSGTKIQLIFTYSPKFSEFFSEAFTDSNL